MAFSGNLKARQGFSTRFRKWSYGWVDGSVYMLGMDSLRWDGLSHTGCRDFQILEGEEGGVSMEDGQYVLVLSCLIRGK